MTITHAHYVGLVVPQCALTYSTPPCQAQLSYIDVNDSPWFITLNTEWARTAGGLTGATDSKLVTGNIWIRPGAIGTNQTIYAGVTASGGSTLRFELMLLSTGQFRIRGWNAGGTVILNVQTSVLTSGQLYHILFSFDLSSTSKRWLYVDGVSDLTVTTYTNDTIDFTLGDWSFGALANGTSLVDSAFAFGQFWFSGAVYIDFSVAANRALFRSADGRPVYLGGNGEVPTGTSPRVYFDNDPGFWENNFGTGGGFGTINNDGNAFSQTMHTGTRKCFNSLGTCQDIANFDNSDPAVIYFGEDVLNYSNVITRSGSVLFPFIKSIDYQSAIVSLGDNMGQRGSVTIKMRDAPHNDTPNSVFDKYASERGYDPLDFGTFWGKFRARNPYMRFQTLYLFVTKKTEDGVTDDIVETRTYFIESISGPDGGTNEVTITAKDALKVADGDFAKAPVQSDGFLSADITDSATSATMAPTGAIDAYPSSGYLCIGGNEIVSYSKTGGDNFSMTRAQLGTTAATHSAQDRLQLVLRYASISPDLIISDLLKTYAGLDASTIDDAAWAAEVSANLGTLYTFVITEPTDVRDLISEVIQQIGGAIWWDDINAQMRLQILKAIATDAERWNEDNTLFDTLKISEQESKRVTRVSVYFAQINPTLKTDETRNYASVATVSDDAVENLVGGKSIKTIFARGIPSGGRTVAERLAQKYLGRYVTPPRKFSLELMKYSFVNPQLGGGYLLGGGDLQNREVAGPFQDDEGSRQEVPIQVTRVNPVGETYQIEAEEMNFTPYGDDIDPTVHTIIFDVSRYDVNLQEIHDSIYAAAVSGDTVNCYINSGVIIGSTSAGSPAFTVGLFAGGVTVNLFVSGRIQGHGGKGSNSTGTMVTAQAGGTALYTRQAINLQNDSEIWGGGGGGGASRGTAGGAPYFNSGGGGAGSIPGDAGNSPPPTTVGPGEPGFYYVNPATAGTTEAGGTAPISPSGANGGGPGLAGSNAAGVGTGVSNSNGGAAGAAVDGTSFVTYTATGDRRGGLIN